MKLRRPRRRDLPVLWDGLMVYLALLNVGLIVFDWSYLGLRPVYLDHLPGLVELYDPWVDRFWLLDLPFLTFFAGEFFLRWWRATRRGVYRRWFFFPLVYWYDLLGIVPLHQFRFFRLFRVVSIYVRLHRSEASSVGQDPVSRSVAWVADVLAEEISDRVAVRILTMAQREIRSGVLVEVVRETLLPRRTEVRRQVSDKVVELLGDQELQDKARDLLELNLTRSIDEATFFRRVPIPDAVLAPLVKGIGEVVYDSIAETLNATLKSPEGQEALEELVDGVMGSFEEELGRGEIEQLLEEAVVDALEEMKRAVRVKRWAESAPERATAGLAAERPEP